MRSVAAVVLGLALLAGCGSAPETTDPTGIDGLTVPTPSPDPADFVDRIDNQWLPLEPGAQWTYQRAENGTRVVRVLDRTREVAGVTTTVVRTEDSGQEGGDAVSESFYAQDSAGNVWILGTTGSDAWLAGRDGARSTLAMAAAPRHGDGYAAAYVDGRVQRRAEVLSNDDSVHTPYGAFDGVVTVEETVPGRNDRSTLSYAPGIGLVEKNSVHGPELELVSFDR